MELGSKIVENGPNVIVGRLNREVKIKNGKVGEESP